MANLDQGRVFDPADGNGGIGDPLQFCILAEDLVKKEWLPRLICATITNPVYTQFLKGFCSIHVSLYLEGWHLEVDILNDVDGLNSLVLGEDVEEVCVVRVEVLVFAQLH